MLSLFSRITSFWESVTARHQDNRPIGLKSLQGPDGDMFTKHMSQSAAIPVAPFTPTLSKKSLLSTAPCFAYAPPSSYTFQTIRDIRMQPQFTGFPHI